MVIMSCECNEKNTRNYYRYYDTPDGCDVMKKVGVTTRYGVIAGILLSSYDVLMYSRAIGMGPVLQRYMFHTIPLGLMGATFALASNGFQMLREKDDKLNYFLGGLCCGPIAAAYLGSGHAVLVGGIALGVVAAIKKEAMETGHVFFPDFQPHKNHVWSWRHDYTLVKDPRDEMIHTCGQSTK